MIALRVRMASYRYPGKLFLAIALCGLMVSPFNARAQSATGATPPAAASRTGICIEHQDVAPLRKRLSALAGAGVSTVSYRYAKAQCWLDSAESQFFENDRTAYVAEGIEESTGLIGSIELEKRAASTLSNTRHIAASGRVREDLWQQIAELKSHPQFECAAAQVACAEVKLVRAGHANDQTGWRQANPHIQMAERMLSQAQSDVSTCANKTVVAPPPPVSPVVAVTPPVAVSEAFSLGADALFLFNRGDKESLLPAGKSKLDWLIVRLKEYQRIDSIDISGFTDRLGSDKYNKALSQTRADTVRDYLLAGGVKASIMRATGFGKSDTAGSQCPFGMERVKLIACLQPDRRVDLVVRGIAKK